MVYHAAGADAAAHRVARASWGSLAIAISFMGGLATGALLMYAWIDRLMGGPYIEKAADETDVGGWER